MMMISIDDDDSGADSMVARIIWLMKILNSNGASVHPCLRPWEILNGGVVLPCIDTWAFVLVRNARISLHMFGGKL